MTACIRPCKTAHPGQLSPRTRGVTGALRSLRLCSSAPCWEGGIELLDPITAALAAGAAAGLGEVAAQAVKDAYGRLKAALTARFPHLAGQVQALESRPDSKAKQGSLSEELAERGAEQDAELRRLAQALVEAIEREAPQAAVRAGVDLKRVKGQFLNVHRVAGGVRVEDAEMSIAAYHTRLVDQVMAT